MNLYVIGIQGRGTKIRKEQSNVYFEVLLEEILTGTSIERQLMLT
jgi:hypothetical protein